MEGADLKPELGESHQQAEKEYELGCIFDGPCLEILHPLLQVAEGNFRLEDIPGDFLRGLYGQMCVWG